MNPTEIADALEVLASQPFDAAGFGLAFAEATDNPRATLAKLHNGSANKSDLDGGILLARKFHYTRAALGDVEAALSQLRASKKNKAGKPAILLATDGRTIAAENTRSGQTLHCAFDELAGHFDFFLPAAGKERYEAAEENPVDVRATGKLARLYDALLKANPAWRTEERRHDMNLFMTRLIFCLFAEDVGVFPEKQFSSVVFNYGGERGEHARVTLVNAFAAMNQPEGSRQGLPGWANSLKYVNGGLFAGTIDAPDFDIPSFRYLRDAAGMDWQLINPDIFGSMIQSIADEKARSELGMHYTSVPNIMKVLGPLFLDDLDAEITKAWDRPAALRAQQARLSRIRIFDPACGSGNFLVVAYRQMREREIQILTRLAELDPTANSLQMFSAVSLNQFYGVEITDFAAETAKLALFIAEYQANARFGDVFGRMPALLPLRDGGNIVRANSLRRSWDEVCPPPQEGEELYIAGNPPFAGAKSQTDLQKADRNLIFESRGLTGYKTLDLVAAWFILATDYINNYPSTCAAFVATSSIVQGRQASALWPFILTRLRINFAYRPFKWRNNAADNAAVDCVVVGISAQRAKAALLLDGDLSSGCDNINAYLIRGSNIYVKQASTSLFGLPGMVYGSMPNDGGALILDRAQAEQIKTNNPEISRLIRPLVGTTELIDGTERYCLWIADEDVELANGVPAVRDRIEMCRRHRLDSKNPETVERAREPHRFWHIGGHSERSSIIIASASSERREVLPVDIRSSDVIPTNLCFVIHDGPVWALSLIASRIHLVWSAAVCGKLDARYRYSSTLGWNTFPAPRFTTEQLSDLSASARHLLKVRYEHYPDTISKLYDPNKMPDDLRQAHKSNDELLETMYIGRPFRNDTERLETLFKLYAVKTAQ